MRWWETALWLLALAVVGVGVAGCVAAPLAVAGVL